MAPKPVEWLILFALSIMWGSAFLFTKVAVGELQPAEVVASRLLIAALILLAVSLVSRRSLNVSFAQLKFFVVMALAGNCLPFFLITWGQQWIASGVAGMLMATMPLVTMSLAHFFLKDERLTGRKIAGFVFGFGGVLVVLGPNNLLAMGGSGRELIGQLAVLAGAFSYACAAILARRGPTMDSLKSATGMTSAASLIMAPIALAINQPGVLSLSREALLAVLALGLFSTAIATLLYFKLIKSAGPGFVSMINYLIPLWAAFLGAIVLHERLEWSAWIALALILFGMFLSQSGRSPSVNSATART